MKAQTTYLKTFEADGTTLKIPTISLADSVVSYQETKDFYQFNITLTKPTAQTVFTFPLETSGLEFYYQPPLNEELDAKLYDVLNATHAISKDGTTYRPINVVSSYAVYKTVKGMGTGKLYHIYRPLLVDAEKKTSWANLSMSKTEMQIICDAGFLKNAVYPVVIDPTFGYTSIGASQDDQGSSRCRACLFTLSEAGTVTQISSYHQAGSTTGYTAIYDDNAGAPNNLITVSSGLTVTSWAWYNWTFNEPLAADNYWLAFCGATFYWKYDSGATNQEAYVGAATPPDPFGAASYNARVNSIYATYTAGAAANHTDATLEETITITSSLDSEKSLYRSLTETTAVTSSAATTKTLYRSSGSSFTVETTQETQKDLGAMFIEQFETVTITVGLYTTKHIAATLIELTETLNIIANLYTSLLVELTTLDLLGLIIVFSVIALAIALCALGLHFKKK